MAVSTCSGGTRSFALRGAAARPLCSQHLVGDDVDQTLKIL